METWEAFFRVILQKHWQSDPSTAPIIQQVRGLVQSFLQSTNPTTCTTQPDIQQQIIPLQKLLLSTDYNKCFMEKLSAADSTCRFWVKFVYRGALAYVGLYLAICGGNWDLSMASLKMMAPMFSAFDHFTYKKVIAQHIADIHFLPYAVKAFFHKGGFVVSITGQPWSSVGIDEAHEMLINRACKTSIVHPSKDYKNRVAGYLPYRTKCIRM